MTEDKRLPKKCKLERREISGYFLSRTEKAEIQVPRWGIPVRVKPLSLAFLVTASQAIIHINMKKKTSEMKGPWILEGRSEAWEWKQGMVGKPSFSNSGLNDLFSEDWAKYSRGLG